MSAFVHKSDNPLSPGSVGAYFAIDVSPGELLDRVTIAGLKATRVTDPEKRRVASEELARLSLALRRMLDSFGPVVDQWMGELHEINSRLWDLESDLRAQIAASADNDQVSRRSREIVYLNDRRAITKARINALLGSEGEVKDYGRDLAAATDTVRQAYRHFSDFLSLDEKDELLERIILRQSDFVATATNGEAVHHRISLVAAADVDTQALFSRRIAEHLPLLASITGDRSFLDPLELECQITAHTNLCHFHVHADNGSDTVRNRALSFVYFLRLRPGSFFGGELKIYPDLKRLHEVVLVRPTDNSAVFFPSNLLHKAIPTYVPSGAFEDSRFTVNGWLAGNAI